MKLAVSNIAWPAEQNEAVAKVLVEEGFTGLEIAPGKLFAKPLDASDAQIDSCRAWWADRGLMIIAAQALLFGRPDLTIFESPGQRSLTHEHLARVIRFCARLGAGALVFGSPKNRAIGARRADEVREIATEFFRGLGDVAAAEGTHLVLEPVPAEYGADFVTRAAEAIELVRNVDHPGFRLHLDTAGMALANDDIATMIRDGLPLLRHFHASEPGMAPLGTTGRVDHAAFARELTANHYPHWVSVEMREVDSFTPAGLAERLRFVREVYG